MASVAKRPAVLHVITDLHTGGAESMMTSLILSRNAQEGQSVVVSLLDGGSFARILDRAGITVFELGMKPGWAILLSFSALFKLIRLIRRLQPDVIQSWMYHADLLALLAWILSGRRKRTRLYWGVRCSNMDTSQYKKTLRAAIRACALLSPLPTAIIANSVAGRDAHRRLGYRPKRFPAIDNGFNLTRFTASPERRRRIREQLGISENATIIALVARVDHMKDHAGFLAAFNKVSGAEALLVGRGTENLPDRPGLHRLGQRSDVPDLLSACDIIVSSSAFGEGFSNALAEGMATELAPIATDVGDAQRIIGDTGIVVPPRDPIALAHAIQELIDDPELRLNLGRKARKRVEKHFSLERTLEAFEAIYTEYGLHPPSSLLEVPYPALPNRP